MTIYLLDVPILRYNLFYGILTILCAPKGPPPPTAHNKSHTRPAPKTHDPFPKIPNQTPSTSI